MTQTQIIPHQPESPSSPEGTSGIPRQLRPLEAGLTDATIAELDSLNAAYQNKVDEIWTNVFNRSFDAAISHGVDRAEAHRLADAEATAIARSRAMGDEDVRDRIARVVNRFLPPEADPNHPDFDPDTQSELYSRTYDAVVHVAEMEESEWLGDYNSDGTRKGDGVLDTLDGALLADDEQGATTSDVLPALSPELQEAQDDLEELRKEKQKASVKLQSIPLWRRNELKAAREEYQKALNEYAEAFKQYQRYLIDYYREGVDDADAAEQDAREKLISDELIDLANEYVQGDIKAEKKMLVDSAGRLGKFGEWYSLQKTSVKLLGGVAVGAVIGAATLFSGGLALGAAGAVIAGAGAVAGRATRGYAMSVSRIYSADPAKIEKFTALVADPENYTLEDLATKYLIDQANAEIKETNKVRLKAVAVAIGSVAVGALAPIALDHLGDIKGAVANKMFGGVKAQDADLRTPDTGGGAGHTPAESAGNQGKAAAEAAAEASAKEAAVKAEMAWIKDMLPDTAAAEKLMSDPNFYKDGEFHIPIESGDGFYALKGRYGLSQAQMEKMMEIAAKQKGETYRVGSDLRIKLGNPGEESYRKMSFKAGEMKDILSAK